MLIQEQVTTDQMRRKAMTVLRGARHGNHRSESRVPLELLVMALHGKNVNFGKVLEMIDGLTVSLGKEQADDDSKKEYCEAELDKLEDKKKMVEQEAADLETAISDTKEKIAAVAADIKA